MAKQFKNITDGSIEAGLMVLDIIRDSDVVYTQEDLAFICGCSITAIRQIERKALRKIKRRLQSKGVRDSYNEVGYSHEEKSCL